MAHPHNEHRAHKHEKDRVSHIAGCSGGEPKHYARGGSVHGDEAEDLKLIRHEVKAEALKHDGKKAAHRGDKVARRAKGGHVKKSSGKTNVNVIVAPSGGQKPPMPPMAGLGAAPPPGMGAAPPMPPRPPMVPPSPQPPMGPPPASGPGGMPIRSNGGRAYKKGGAVSSSEKGYGPKSSADDKGKTGIGDRTPIQHSGNKSDTQNIGRGKPITYATGGPVYSDGKPGKQMAPKLPAGSGGGKGRIAKAKMENKAGHEKWEPGIVR